MRSSWTGAGDCGIKKKLLFRSSDQQNAVFEFIAHLKKSQSPVKFRAALDQFTREHPEMLRLLAN